MGNISHTEKEIFRDLIDPLVQVAADERPHGSHLESREQFIAKVTKKIHHSFSEYKKCLTSAIHVLAQHKKWPNDERYKRAEAWLQDREKLEEGARQGKTLQEIFSFTDEDLTLFYGDAWECYQRGSFEEAGNIFLLLVQLNPKVAVFWFALGTAKEKQNHLQEAIQAYLFASELETETLAPYFNGARCLLLDNKVDEAKRALHRAIERAEHEPLLHDQKNQALQLLNNIK